MKILTQEEAYKRNPKCLLDTSFILTCVRNKIDFFEQLELEGFKILVPKQVIKEIEAIKNSKKSEAKSEANLALKLIKTKKPKIIQLKGKTADNAIISYTKQNPSIIVATLDREIKNKTKNRKLVIRSKKKLEII